MAQADTLNLALCRRLGVKEEFLKIWTSGVHLQGHEEAPSYDLPDYPSVRDQPHIAAQEIDRLTAEGRIYRYTADVPEDLDICPSTLIRKVERSRLVRDWTRAGLNSHLVKPTNRLRHYGCSHQCLAPGMLHRRP